MLLFVNCGLVLLVVQPVVGMPRDKRTVDPSPDHALMTRRSYGDLEELKANVTKLQDIIKDQEEKIQDLQAAGRGVGRSKRSDDTSPDQAVLARLTTDLTELQAKVTALQNTVHTQETQINDLKAAGDRHVAFAAYINHEPNLAASSGAIVAFAGVITNIGSAYNPATSVFTAPYDAVYMFFVGVDVSQDCIGVDIRENGRKIAEANNDGYINTHVSAAVTLSLKAGDVITVTYYSTKGVVDAGIESVFTGFMLA